MKIKHIDREEKYNTISHGVGVVVGLVILVLLLQKNYAQDFWTILGVTIYAISFILLFLASTVYHALINPKKKHIARKLDHIGIFFHIAGTYTPICLITLRETSGIMLLTVIWSIAFAGLLMKIFLTGKLKFLSTLLYLIMGWIAVVEFKTLYQLLEPISFFFLVLGGVFYTIGVVFYTSKKINYNHFIWHIFVLAGSISHFLMIYFL